MGDRVCRNGHLISGRNAGANGGRLACCRKCQNASAARYRKTTQGKETRAKRDKRPDVLERARKRQLLRNLCPIQRALQQKRIREYRKTPKGIAARKRETISDEQKQLAAIRAMRPENIEQRRRYRESDNAKKLKRLNWIRTRPQRRIKKREVYRNKVASKYPAEMRESVKAVMEIRRLSTQLENNHA